MPPTHVFISYSHKDEAYKTELEKYLVVLKREGLISVWTDRQIMPGDNFNKEIIKKLETADLIIFLISVDFIVSEYITNIEYKTALAQHNSGVSIIVPVILRKCPWEKTEIGGLLALPIDGRAINTWKDKNAAFNLVEQGIRNLILNKLDNRIPNYYKSIGNAKSTVLIANPSKYFTEGIVRRFLMGSVYKITSKRDHHDLQYASLDDKLISIMNSPIGLCYESRGGTGSDLGFPISEAQEAWESKTSKGYIQWFEGGSIYSTEIFGARILLNGNIRNKIVELENSYFLSRNINLTGGILGFPITNQELITSKFGKNGIVQRFEGGYIIDSELGTFSINLGFYNLYQSIDNWNGELGFPKSDDSQLMFEDQNIEGTYQEYENGWLIWNKQNNHCLYVFGEIYTYWIGDINKFGLPINAQYVVNNFSIQNFMWGTIKWDNINHIILIEQ